MHMMAETNVQVSLPCTSYVISMPERAVDTEMLCHMEKSIGHCIGSVPPAKSLQCRRENSGASSWETDSDRILVQNKGSSGTTWTICISDKLA
jgi:hypothetical protein